MIKTIKKWLSSIFEVEDMDEPRRALGVEIVRNYPKKLLKMC